MQRRVFIQLSTYTAAALSFPFATGCTRKHIDAEAQPQFFLHIVDTKTILVTGQAYRKANQGEDDKNKLKELLLANSALSSSSGERSIVDMLVSRVDNDFKTGKIVLVNGWVLSLTEARQCALFSIVES